MTASSSMQIIKNVRHTAAWQHNFYEILMILTNASERFSEMVSRLTGFTVYF